MNFKNLILIGLVLIYFAKISSSYAKDDLDERYADEVCGRLVQIRLENRFYYYSLVRSLLPVATGQCYENIQSSITSSCNAITEKADFSDIYFCGQISQEILEEYYVGPFYASFLSSNVMGLIDVYENNNQLDSALSLIHI